MKCSRSGRITATAFSSKGVTEFGVELFSGNTKKSSIKRLQQFQSAAQVSQDEPKDNMWHLARAASFRHHHGHTRRPQEKAENTEHTPEDGQKQWTNPEKKQPEKRETHQNKVRNKAENTPEEVHNEKETPQKRANTKRDFGQSGCRYQQTPTERPTDQPTNQPTNRPTNRPTNEPTPEGCLCGTRNFFFRMEMRVVDFSFVIFSTYPRTTFASPAVPRGVSRHILLLSRKRADQFLCRTSAEQSNART